MGRGQGSRVQAGGAQRRVVQRVIVGRKSWRWTDQDIEAELRAFTVEATAFPSSREFDAAGRADLRHAVRKKGTAYWAQRVRLPLGSRQDRQPYSIERAVEDARSVVLTHGGLPSVPRLRELGLGRLATRVQEAGGAERFSKKYLRGAFDDR